MYPGLRFSKRTLHTEHVKANTFTIGHLNDSPTLEALPLSCPGCGAYTQLREPDEAGYFSLTRKPVKVFLAAQPSQTSDDGQTPGKHSIGQTEEYQSPPKAPSIPICDRCHNLIHHHEGVPVVHPTLSAIQAIFEETPYTYNHVYHVIDAADFPMSLIPRLHEWLDLSPQRSLNRRSKHAKYRHGRKAEMSFIITRSDLLAPKKEQIDTLMPVIVRILRRALGRTGRDIRLGNVRLVSSHRGWWTSEVKEAIWERGGGGWMVGKVNVGKSNLFENILPKGRVQAGDLARVDDMRRANAKLAGSVDEEAKYDQVSAVDGEEDLQSGNLLPPRPQELQYPVLPVVSQLPGTTASPIRVPFGKGKGELIDLPGLSRGGLEELILDENRPGLVMKSRVKAKQVVIQPWQSLVISNIIRITPTTPDVTFLACPFLPHDVEYHVCHTDKAKEILAQSRNHVIKGIAKPEVAETIQSAGNFQLPWDITLQRAGPLTAKDAVGLAPDRLPFAVFGLDLLVEGIGWIELSAQIRRKALEQGPFDPATGDFAGYPEIEVFSPNGKHVGQRETLNAWLLGGQRKPSKRLLRARPKSMKGVKKAEKLKVRAERARQRAADNV
jgi:genetic interactor of prohibitins 3, mitochondrial